MNIFGLTLGLITLLIIALGFIWVIRTEYFLGYLWWHYVLGVGILLVIGSLFVPSMWGSAVMGVLGASLIWGATELKNQARRAELGWFPYNPNQKPKPPFAEKIEKLTTLNL